MNWRHRPAALCSDGNAVISMDPPVRESAGSPVLRIPLVKEIHFGLVPIHLNSIHLYMYSGFGSCA
jgi:hypothetical protein